MRFSEWEVKQKQVQLMQRSSEAEQLAILLNERADCEGFDPSEATEDDMHILMNASELARIAIQTLEIALDSIGGESPNRNRNRMLVPGDHR